MPSSASRVFFGLSMRRATITLAAVATAATVLLGAHLSSRAQPHNSNAQPSTSSAAHEQPSNHTIDNTFAAHADAPIRLVLGFPAGTAVDATARLIQEPLARALGRPVVVEYKTGAAGNIASEYVARAQPDGLTLLLGTAATHGSNAALYPKLPFDVEQDFTPIASLLDMSNVLAINTNVINATNLHDFIAQVRAKPSIFNYSSSGNGTGLHMAFADFNHRLGLNMVHVPYKGGAEAVAAMLRGEVCCVMAQVQAIQPHMQNPNVRLLGVTTVQHVPALPDINPLASSAVAALQGFDLGIWFGLFAPRGLPDAQRDALNAAVQQVLSQPELRARVHAQGNTVRLETAAQFRQTVRDNRLKWQHIVQSTGTQLQ